MSRHPFTPLLFVCAAALAVGGFLTGRASGQDAGRPEDVAAPVESAFTYQGDLRVGAAPAGGVYDFRFRLYAAASGDDPPVAEQVVDDVQVVGGRFTVLLDFGPAAFQGEARWLGVAVRDGDSSDPYTPLSPRRPLTPAPYALSLRPGATISQTAVAPAMTLNSVGAGLTVGSTGGHGVVVDEAGSEGVYVVSSEGVGVHVVRSGSGGVVVNDAASDGATVFSAGQSGLHVGTAATNGVRVDEAGGDGFFVCTTGSEPECFDSPLNNGLEVGSAEGHGLRVDQAGRDGVLVDAADEDGVDINYSGANGVSVSGAAGHGVFVDGAGVNGVMASTDTSAAYGGSFANEAGSGQGAGLYARGNVGTAPDIVLGANVAGGLAADDGRIVSDPAYSGSDIRFFTNDNLWIDLDESDSHSGSNFTIRDSDNNTVWRVDETGSVTNRGTDAAVVEAGAYGDVQLYAVQSPENWFEDFGSASLAEGAATVTIDPVFAETVNLGERYHVYLTPLGDCALYVAEKTAASFTVRAQDGRPCAIDFDYRIVARRAGYEDARLASPAPAGEEE